MISTYERKELAKKEFELDCKIKQYQEAGDNGTAEYCRNEQKKIQYRAHGWRSMSSDIDNVTRAERELLNELRMEVENLKTTKAKYDGLVSSGPETLKNIQKRLDELRGHLASSVGHSPDIEELKTEQQKLIDQLADIETANSQLPIIEKILEAAEKKLKQTEDKILKSKAWIKDKKFSDPSEELAFRAKQYSRRYNMDYTSASTHILESDPVLEYAYKLGIY